MAYLWRTLSSEQRALLLSWRRDQRFPWHSPPHAIQGRSTFLLTAACLRHAPHVGRSPERLSAFCDALLTAIGPVAAGIHAWCVLPNHYHLLVSVRDLRSASWALGKLHGRTAYQWNREECSRGRQVWHAAADRFMRSDRHFWATLNYIHHNPVRHGYVARWQDWPYSSAPEFLEGLGRDEAERVWREYPLEDYGREWDQPTL